MKINYKPILAVIGVIAFSYLIYFYIYTSYSASLFVSPVQQQNPKTLLALKKVQSEDTLNSELLPKIKEPTIQSMFSYPYPVSWREGDSMVSVTGVSVGLISEASSSQSIGIALYVKVHNIGSTACIPVRIQKLIDENGAMSQPINKSFIFSGTHDCHAVTGTTYDAQQIIFKIDPGQKSFEFSSGGSNPVFFNVSIGDSNISIKPEPKSETDTNACSLNSASNLIDNCLIGKAMASHDETVCLNVSDPGGRLTCTYAVTAINKDLFGCKALEGSGERDECYGYYASTNGEVSTCDLVLGRDAQSACFVNLALRLRDVTVCQKVAYDSWKAQCLGQLGGGQTSIASCKALLTGHEAISDCITKIARQNHDISICDMLTDKADKQDCYIDVGVIDEGDITICQNRIDNLQKDGCYSAYATTHNSIESCNLIVDQGYLKSCKAFFTIQH